MEGILLDTMFDLPGLEGVEQVVIGPEVVEGKARPLYIYAERNEKSGASASARCSVARWMGFRRRMAARKQCGVASA